VTKFHAPIGSYGVKTVADRYRQ